MIAMLLKRQRRRRVAGQGRAGHGRGVCCAGSGCGSGKTGDCCESATAAGAAGAAATFEERVALYASRAEGYRRRRKTRTRCVRAAEAGYSALKELYVATLQMDVVRQTECGCSDSQYELLYSENGRN